MFSVGLLRLQTFWRHGRAPERAAGRARPRGLAEGAGGPVQQGDEPQRGVQAAVVGSDEDEEAARLLLQAPGAPRTLQTSTGSGSGSTEPSPLANIS